ncbi:MAG: metallophosphoesterase [Bacillota bacterium]
MGKFTDAVNIILGRVIIDPKLTESAGSKLLHISDTPSSIYPEIKRIVKVLKPDYIIHTGDIADNLKLELYPSYLSRYRHEARKILEILNSSSAKRVIISLGNHDDPEFVKENAGRIEIIEEMKLISINDVKFAVSHYSEYLTDVDADFYLFGHDLSINSQVVGDKKYLNGISAIHLIDLHSLHVEEIGYPLVTDSERLKRRKTKL